MYRKYMHSRDRKVNPKPVTEFDVGAAAAAALVTAGVGAAMVSLGNSSRKKTIKEDRRIAPLEANDKADAIFKKTLNKSTYKKLKTEFNADIAERFNPNDITMFNSKLATMGNFYFHAVDSEAEENRLISLFHKFVDDLNNQIHKFDKTYSFQGFYEDGYWWVDFTSV